MLCICDRLEKETPQLSKKILADDDYGGQSADEVGRLGGRDVANAWVLINAISLHNVFTRCTGCEIISKQRKIFQSAGAFSVCHFCTAPREVLIAPSAHSPRSAMEYVHESASKFS